MTGFKPALWDGSDPLYAPGIKWNVGKNPAIQYPQWNPPAKYKKAGYAYGPVKLDPPGHKDDEHQPARALRCRELTKEMLRWYEEQEKPKVDPSTWKYLIARYQTDEYSPFHDVKENTREGYVQHLRLLEDVIGHTKISSMTYEAIKKLQKAMQAKKRSISYIHRFFNTMRRVAKYGKALNIQSAREVAETLSEMRFQNSPARQVAPTRDQVYTIIQAADAEGLKSYALGIMIQYEFALRAVDVRGHWLKTDELEGGIIHNGTRWQDGLTWDMIDNDLTRMEKLISKTRKSLTEPYIFDLTGIPEIQARLKELRPKDAVGPVILNPHSGLPYTIYGWSQTWARLRKKTGIPEEIRMMDVRAGAVTEAKSLGADPYMLRDAAQHKDVMTTDRYSRARSDSANNVVRLRQSRG
ncbi:tyrosine-type recombinase/integrase [Tritonibacter mobilis]|uniref:tyrosine-type recombinase/integrase n=1 Tax=Tritonibacter mobilis TaxID=379347 RepID=UPI00080687B5|nr:recombinase [Tritonibacter mobilis]